MILCGLSLDHCNCAGYGHQSTVFFEADDVHDAAIQTIKSTWTTGYQVQTFLNGEFHDTNTATTWSVDSRGHTKKDYRHESEYEFRERWGK